MCWGWIKNTNLIMGYSAYFKLSMLLQDDLPSDCVKRLTTADCSETTANIEKAKGVFSKVMIKTCR